MTLSNQGVDAVGGQRLAAIRAAIQDARRDRTLKAIAASCKLSPGFVQLVANKKKTAISEAAAIKFEEGLTPSASKPMVTTSASEPPLTVTSSVPELPPTRSVEASLHVRAILSDVRHVLTDGSDTVDAISLVRKWGPLAVAVVLSDAEAQMRTGGLR